MQTLEKYPKEYRYDVAMLRTAVTWALMSKCNRKKVGAVIASPDYRILAHGINGAPSGFENDVCEENGKTLDHVIHAEMNAIIYAAKRGIAIDGCSIYLTLSPCKKCSASILQSGIKRVCYMEDYRDSGIDFLKEHGVEVVKMTTFHVFEPFKTESLEKVFDLFRKE